MAMAGANSDTNDSNGIRSGHTMPMTPIGSFTASAMLCTGGVCTSPSYLSAQAP